MTIAYSNTSVASGTSSASVAAPASVATDMLLVCVKIDRATSGTTTAPTGWTRVASTASTSGRIEVFVGVYGRNSMSAGPWSFTGTTRTLARIESYTGATTADPGSGYGMDAAPVVRYNASGTTGTAGITPVTNNAMILAAFGSLTANYTWSAETAANGPTLANEQESAYSTYLDLALVNAILATAGATGNTSATQSTGGNNAGAVVAIRPAVAPTVTDSAASSIAADSATGNGNVTADGGLPVTERGVCYNTTGTPTTSDSKGTTGTGTGSFTSSLTGLLPNTLYYTRAYAINAIGTSYSSGQTFTTLDWPIRLAASANIAASAATSTTQQLTGGTGGFTAGRISDDTNPLPSIDLGSAYNSELEFSIQSTSVASASDVFQFRITKAGVVLDSYSQTPQWTIASAGGGAPGAAQIWYTMGDGHREF